jgi:HK97 family phage major capsid protein
MDLKDKAGKLLHDARALMEKADAEGRTLTAEENTRYQAIMDDFDATHAQIKRAAKLAEAEAAIASRGPVAGRESFTVVAGESRTASPEYRAAFWSAMTTGRIPEEFRVLSVGTDTAGGFTVPDDFRRQLLIGLEQANVMRGLSTVFTTTSGVLSLPVVSTHASAGWVAENAAYSASDSGFTEVTLNAYKNTMLVKASEELLNDSAFDMASFIASQAGRGLGRLEETAFVAGTGSGQPTGVVGSAGLGKTATATNAITADELMDTQYALGRAYRKRATWLMHDSTVKALRKLKTGVSSDNTYLWSPGLDAAEPDRLLGNPVVTSQDMAEMTTGLKPVLFGDFSYYYIGDRQSIGLQRLVELYAANGQVGFRIFKRTDGKLALAEAVKYLIMA